MRRPFVFFVLHICLGIVCAYGFTVGPLPASLALLFGIVAEGIWLFGSRLYREPRRLLALALGGLLAGMVLFAADEMRLDGARQDVQDGVAVHRKGVVVRAVYGEERILLTLRDEASPMGPYVRVSLYGHQREQVLREAPLEGRRMEVAGDVSLPTGARNPGGYNAKVYLSSQGIAYTVTAKQATVLEVANPGRWHLDGFRLRAKEELAKGVGEDRLPLLLALILGEKEDLADEDYARFQQNGTAHLLAVSGLHLGLLYGFVSFLLGRPHQKGAGAVTLGLLVLYALLTGANPPVMRALIMVGLKVGSLVWHRPYDMISGAALAALVLLAMHPMLLFTTGFQCSFLAVLLLAMLFAALKRWDRPWMNHPVVKLVLPLWLLQVLLIPYTAFRFHYICGGAFLANLPLALLAELLIPTGLLALLVLGLSPAGPLLPTGGTAVLCRFLDVLAGVLWRMNELTYQEGRFTALVPGPPAAWVLVFYGLLFFAGSEAVAVWVHRHDDAGRFLVRGTLITALALGLLIHGTFDEGFRRSDYVFVDVGQGSCLHVRAGDRKHILVDGGGSDTYDVGTKVTAPYLLTQGVGTIDLALVTHLDTDHYQGVVSLCRMGMVRRLGISAHLRDLEQDIAAETGLSPNQLLWLSAGDELTIGKTEIRVLGPVKHYDDPNRGSLILQIEKGNRERFSKGDEKKEATKQDANGSRLLVTGDIDTEVEGDLVNAYDTAPELLDCDILWIPHHGSKYSSSEALVKATKPTLAVAQAGAKNRYGHPAEEVLVRYEQAGARVYRNDRQGTVGITLRKGQFSVRTMDP